MGGPDGMSIVLLRNLLRLRQVDPGADIHRSLYVCSWWVSFDGNGMFVKGVKVDW